MTQSAYSWMGTRIHLVVADDVAAAYNRAQDAYRQAQLDHLARTGKEWNPATEALEINWTVEERTAFNKLAKVINAIIDLSGPLDIPEDEIKSDYLEKL